MRSFDLGLAAAIVVLSVTVCLWRRPTLQVAVLCAMLSAAWWPANNGVLEGPVLVRVTQEHGFTAADLLGVFGLACASSAVLRARRTPGAKLATLLIISAIAASGAAAAYATG